ncbi:nucleoside-diphosphate-sugar epimerase [Candidatus Scalindua japonica]|uniref:Nucleoside-diphosphate-sugar epimerase n=1 Tax=Candidatus Scalindua japonica TaxID=1284222 RepID=A0A286U468_9BACT|nr:GDP-mannose 4,6-dehydratase [Candidatus Scalindua japonica]GAX62923.1 nucleoside-diphosphate-sugar epimerase [Candidatus Scalindua japonica]
MSEQSIRLDCSFWKDRTALITGATGMVGSWLVKDLLTAGARVIALVRDSDYQTEFFRSGDYHKTTIVNGRIEDYDTVERAINEHEVNTVFHLAAMTIVGTALRSPLACMEANIRGTYNVLEACRVYGNLIRQVVIASSDKAYGDQPHLPYNEDMPLIGRHPYDVSKSCTDLISQAYVNTYDLPLAIARCGNIFGGGDLNWSRIVPGTIRALLARESPVIRSNGKFIRDYVYVKDISRAYMRLAECIQDPQVRGNAFNFSLERPMNVLEIVDLIQKLMHQTDIELDIRDKVSCEIKSQFLDSTRARETLQWTPQFSLEAGMRETIEWYESYLQTEA